MPPVFISDLHLHGSRPEVSSAFLEFLQGPASGTDTLYILGDLFDAWIGDDVADAHDLEIMDALRRYTNSGRRCRFLHGNRDFLIGAQFSGVTGVEVLNGPQVIEVADQPALIMHGDELCIDDRDYQRLRRVVRNPGVQWAFSRLPARVRRRVADRLRSGSTASQTRKAPRIMDVNQDAVAATMRHYGVTLLIHGHTHRPAIHDFSIDSRRARRIVLGDWYTQGSVLVWNDCGPDLRTIAFD